MTRSTAGRAETSSTSDGTDRVSRDCEVVARRIANDPLANLPVGQHRTQVESHSLANGSTIVSVFQTGRFVDGAATAIGFSTSTNGGRTWRAGLLPGVTRYSPAPGESPRASDPVVAYDALHDVWLANTLIVGVTFEQPFRQPLRRRDHVVCAGDRCAHERRQPRVRQELDRLRQRRGEPVPRTCYIAYSDVTARRMALLVSRDGGATWAPPVTIDASIANSIGAIPLVQPDGALTVVYIGGNDMVASRLTDGGATFAPPIAISPFVADELRSVRAPPLPAATVDAAGRLYVLWMDCRLRRSCTGNDLVLSSSTDGTTWPAPSRLPRASLDSSSPGSPRIRRSRAGSGSSRTCGTRPCTRDTCRFGVAFMRSTNGGATWSTPQRLDAEQMQPTWLAGSNLGAFVGDYVGIAYTATAIVPTFPFATRPTGRTLNEAMFASIFPD